jgi:glucokinase
MTLIGIDIGGTNSRVGIVSAEGQVLARVAALTAAARGPEATIDSLLGLIHQVLTEGRGHPMAPLAIGIAISGPVDVHTGIVSNPYTLGGWPPTDIVTPFRSAFLGATVIAENDANAAALGEWRVGVGRGTKRFVLVTLGTGVGVGFVVDGRIQRGSTGDHGEAGHLVLDPAGPPCYCGARGCWEVLASGTALSKRLQDSNGADGHRHAIEEAARWTGLALVNLCAVFSPDAIAIGGGAGANFDVMQGVLSAVMRQHRRLIPTDIPVWAARTGDDAGLIGAALLAQGQRATTDGLTAHEA